MGSSTRNMLLILFEFTIISALAQSTCIDRHGDPVAEGETFHPKKEDSCYSCTCIEGGPSMCMTASCAAPACPNYRPDPEQCCKFICNGDDFTDPEERRSQDGEEEDVLPVIAMGVGASVLLLSVAVLGALIMVKRRNPAPTAAVEKQGLETSSYPYMDLGDQQYYSCPDVQPGGQQYYSYPDLEPVKLQLQEKI